MLGPLLPRESDSSIRPYAGNANSEIHMSNGKGPEVQNYGNQSGAGGRRQRRNEDGKEIQEGVKVGPSLKG